MDVMAQVEGGDLSNTQVVGTQESGQQKLHMGKSDLVCTCQVQTVESSKGFSEKKCPWEVSRIIRFPEGCSPKGKSDNPRDLPRANFPNNL